MAKGQKRGNREIKKPKQAKEQKPAGASFAISSRPQSKIAPRRERPGG